MKLTEGLRNAILAVTGEVETGHSSAEDAVETLDILFRLLICAEATEADKAKEEDEAGQPNPDGMSLDDKKFKPHLTLTDIAKLHGISSLVTHIPHPTAVAAIISHLKLEPCEYETTKDGTLYSSSVTYKVGDWLVENDYPSTITSADGADLHVIYDY